MKEIFANILEKINTSFPLVVFINVIFLKDRIGIEGSSSGNTSFSKQFKYSGDEEVSKEEIKEFKDEIKKLFPESFIGNINSTSNDFVIIKVNYIKEKLQNNRNAIFTFQSKASNDVFWKFYFNSGCFFLSPKSSLEFLRLLESQELFKEFYDQYQDTLSSSLFDLAQIIKIKKDTENILYNLDLKFTDSEKLFLEVSDD